MYSSVWDMLVAVLTLLMLKGSVMLSLRTDPICCNEFCETSLCPTPVFTGVLFILNVCPQLWQLKQAFPLSLIWNSCDCLWHEGMSISWSVWCSSVSGNLSIEDLDWERFASDVKTMLLLSLVGSNLDCWFLGGEYSSIVSSTEMKILCKQCRPRPDCSSDQGLHCLPFRLHRLDSLLYGRATWFKC